MLAFTLTLKATSVPRYLNRPLRVPGYEMAPGAVTAKVGTTCVSRHVNVEPKSDSAWFWRTWYDRLAVDGGAIRYSRADV